VIGIRRYEGEVERRLLCNKQMLPVCIAKVPIVAVLGKGYYSAVIHQISVIFDSMCGACCWMLEVRCEIFTELYYIILYYIILYYIILYYIILYYIISYHIIPYYIEN